MDAHQYACQHDLLMDIAIRVLTRANKSEHARPPRMMEDVGYHLVYV